MKKIGKLMYYVDTVRFVFGMIKIAFNPKDISPIFNVKSFREHKSLKMSLESLKSIPEINDLINTRYLSPNPYSLEELIKLPNGSLGREYAEHMTKYKLDVVFYPAMDSKIDDDINYMRMRARQTHDVHHVVLGYPAEDAGEVAISAFYLAQNKIPLSGLLIGVGFFNTILKQPHRIDELVECLIRGWTSGKKAKHFLGLKWEEYWHVPIIQVREMMGIELPPADLFSANSNGYNKELQAVN